MLIWNLFIKKSQTKNHKTQKQAKPKQNKIPTPQNMMFQISLLLTMKINISVSECLKRLRLHCSLSSNANKDSGPAYLRSFHLINIKKSWLKDPCFSLPFKVSATEGLIFCSLQHGWVGRTLI